MATQFPLSAPPVKASEYYRASTLGEGSYGSVVTVYDDDGNEYAAKIFDEEEDEDELGGIDVGTLREISMLRLLNGVRVAEYRAECRLGCPAHTTRRSTWVQAHIRASCLSWT